MVSLSVYPVCHILINPHYWKIAQPGYAAVLYSIVALLPRMIYLLLQIDMGGISALHSRLALQGNSCSNCLTKQLTLVAFAAIHRTHWFTHLHVQHTLCMMANPPRETKLGGSFWRHLVIKGFQYFWMVS